MAENMSMPNCCVCTFLVVSFELKTAFTSMMYPFAADAKLNATDLQEIEILVSPRDCIYIPLTAAILALNGQLIQNQSVSTVS